MTLDPVELLETLVAFDTRNDGEMKATRKCPEYINNILNDFGFHTEIIESEGYTTAFARRGHGKFKILFLAHFDIVPFGEGWDSDPLKLKVDGDKAYGRGTCDDKGNIVSLLLLAEKLAKSDFPCTIMTAVSGDEEIGGRQGAGALKEYLVKQGLFPDYVVVADGSGQQIIHRRRNILPTYIKVKERMEKIKGRKETVRIETETFGTNTRHSAYLRFGVDRHAMIAASKYLDLNPYTVIETVRGAFLKSNVVPDWVEMDVIHPDEAGAESSYDAALTDLMRSILAMSQVAFPTKPSDKGTNICPNILSKENDLWTLYVDIRSMTNDGEVVKAAFQDALKGHVDLFSLKVHAGIGYVDCDPDSRLIRAAKWALEKEGIPYRIIEGFGGSDSRYFAGEGADLFDFGPRGDNVHGANEWVSIESLKENAEVFHTLIDVLLRKPGSL
ncbi:MAG: Succinyl-diaminopimelate desuccinylase [Candidatus Thorarchaeota archaeon AB_25]|nr:MAG: Succinyl-diaminopimelate desuccinylase [Candidatus Thorarchaeota archaeon AB_25]